MSLLIGQHIVSALSAKSVSDIVGSRIYPIVIPEGTPRYPFLVYKNLGCLPDYTKDGKNEDSCNVQISIVAKSYDDVILLANIVRYRLESVTAIYDHFTVNSAKVTGTDEDYIESVDAYCETLIFDFKTNDK